MKYPKPFLRLIKQSAKKSFQLLRLHGPYSCEALGEEVFVTKLFFDHIAHNRLRKRPVHDLVERLLIIPLISEVISYGVLTEDRIVKTKLYRKIAWARGLDTFVAIVVKDKDDWYLLSCFIEKKTQKNNPS